MSVCQHANADFFCFFIFVNKAGSKRPFQARNTKKKPAPGADFFRGFHTGFGKQPFAYALFLTTTAAPITATAASTTTARMPASDVGGVDEAAEEVAAAEDSAGAAEEAASDSVSDSSVVPVPAVPNASNSETNSQFVLCTNCTFTYFASMGAFSLSETE